MLLCDGLSGIEGLSCSFSVGMFPHITIGSWWATASEFEEAKPTFTEKLVSTEAIEASVKLDEKERNEGTAYSYHFVFEKTDDLVRFHAGIHERLNYPYEPYRAIDLPGTWLPHLTLFTVPKDKKCLVDLELKRLNEITRVEITRLGLVTFYPRIVTAMEIPLRNRVSSA